ncbi:uncharacterized protein LOC133803281 [Humulus lupulus]|uniref:uncharacterized protein LOC133803281 n=1 Tax=Humulus lupulus TaxID=3486 RepID=UPI002B4061E4|nr:uncharacterized protein LOC133803281 [Humulus lupulus]
MEKRTRTGIIFRPQILKEIGAGKHSLLGTSLFVNEIVNSAGDEELEPKENPFDNLGTNSQKHHAGARNDENSSGCIYNINMRRHLILLRCRSSLTIEQRFQLVQQDS